MSKHSKLTLTPELRRLIERYQQDNHIETLTGALYELMARGYSNWQMEIDEDGVQPSWCAEQADEDALFQEFEADQSAPNWFALWFARRFAPKHGGKREGAGRKQAD